MQQRRNVPVARAAAKGTYAGKMPGIRHPFPVDRIGVVWESSLNFSGNAKQLPQEATGTLIGGS